MIKKSALQPRLAEVGKIKIGGVGKELTSKAGNKYRQPLKFGHFIVTGTERDKSTGNFKPDEKIMKTIGGNARELRVRLYFDDVEMNLQTEFANYTGKKRFCSGDGEKALRMIDDKPKEIHCPGTDCEYFKQKKCKASARLFCALADSMEIGGVHVFRTHSINSVMAMTGALEFFKNNTNGILQGLPLKLKMVKKTTEEHGDIDYVTIVLDGVEMLEMRESAALELENRKRLGVNMESYQLEIKNSGVLIDHDSSEDVQDEFYGFSIDPEELKTMIDELRMLATHKKMSKPEIEIMREAIEANDEDAIKIMHEKVTARQKTGSTADDVTKKLTGKQDTAPEKQQAEIVQQDENPGPQDQF